MRITLSSAPVVYRVRHGPCGNESWLYYMYLYLVASHLCLGFVVSSWFSQNSWHLPKIPTVTGLQGVFFNLSTWKKRQEAQPKMQGVFFLTVFKSVIWTKIQATLIHVPACCAHPFLVPWDTSSLTNKQTTKTKGRKTNQLCQRWPTAFYPWKKISQLLISPASSQGILGRLLPLDPAKQMAMAGLKQVPPSSCRFITIPTLMALNLRKSTRTPFLFK